jgi:predicted esterase
MVSRFVATSGWRIRRSLKIVCMVGRSLVACLLGFIGWVAAAPAAADSAADWARMRPQPPRFYECLRAAEPPAIDGRLEDDAWRNAAWTESFVDIEGDRQAAPRFRTRVKMLWDDQYFYIAADMEEPHVWGTLRERDSVIFQDNDFELFVDPDSDHHEYYEFEINALNTGWDLFLPKPYKDGGKADNGWDIGGLRTAIHVDGTLNNPTDTDRGWSVEIAIPWKSFDRARRANTPPVADEWWRVNFSRVEWRHQVVDGQYKKVPNTPENNWVWSPQGIIDMHRPERWGYVRFANATQAAQAVSVATPARDALAIPARDALMTVYHHEKSYHARHGRWTDKLEELGVPPAAWKGLVTPPAIQLTAAGYTASLVIPGRTDANNGGTGAAAKDSDRQLDRWQVDQESRLWRVARQAPPSSDSKPSPPGQRLPNQSAPGQRSPEQSVPGQSVPGDATPAGKAAPAGDAAPAEDTKAVRGALERAAENRGQLELALRETPADQLPGMRFLIAHMPDSDLRRLTADYLLENVSLAYESWRTSPWQAQVPEDVFFNEILPYASVNERRDRWRRDFRDRCLPLIQDAKTPGLAAARLNQKIFPLFNVRYSTKRAKADQSPYESIESGLASCTGLSLLLINACRAVGVPARFCGTPLWADNSGNHSWVEVWDNGWHFTGAAEPAGDKLDNVWFADRASHARRDHPLHAIYASSFRRTPSPFPMIWAPTNREVPAVNVTDRYALRVAAVPAGSVRVRIRVVDSEGERVAARVTIANPAGDSLFTGTANDERFDRNDHVTAVLAANGVIALRAEFQGRSATVELPSPTADQLITVKLPPAPEKPAPEKPTSEKPAPEKPRLDKAGDEKTAAAAATDKPSDTGPAEPPPADASAAAVHSLESFLTQDAASRGAVDAQPFATTPLTRGDADRAEKLLWKAHQLALQATRADELKANKVKLGEWEMPIHIRRLGEKPATGWSLYLSLHGGGGTTPQVNDGQWNNQKRLYTPVEGLYVAPRAPTNTWNLWHQDHIDGLFDRLIESLVAIEDVDPNRIYLLGYSAGGDGVYQLAPRMADRFAGAAMMAGHPNETSPLGLRNLPFAIYMGGLDAAYGRNKTAADWQTQLVKLREQDPQGYPHLVTIYPDKGHWMDRQDASAIPWLAEKRRNPIPEKIVWKQDDVTHSRFYWLAVDDADRRERTEIVATRDTQRIDLRSETVSRLKVRLNDQMLDLDRPVTITRAGQSLITKRISRTISTLQRTITERGDPRSVFSAELSVTIATDSTGR